MSDPKIDKALGILKGIGRQAINHSVGNHLHEQLLGKGSPGELLEAKKITGEALDESQIEPLYTAFSDAIDNHNSRVIIKKPTLAEVVDIINS